MVLHTMDLFMEAEEVSLDVVLLPVVSHGQELQLAFPVNIDLPGMCFDNFHFYHQTILSSVAIYG